MTLSRPAGLRAGFHADVADGDSGLVHAGEQWAPERFPIGAHQHAVWEFYLQLHGVTRWVAGDRIYPLRPGDLFAVPPRLRHRLSGRSGSHHLYFAAIDLEPVRRRHPALPLDWPDAVVHRPGGTAATAFGQLVAELTARQEHPGTGLALAVDHLVLAIVRAMAPAPAARLVLHPAVTRVRHLLDQRFDERWTLGRLADEVGLAPSYLAELFAGQLGQPPHAYLTERRVERARYLLERTDLPVTSIALALGFSSSQHFARVFGQHTAMTPTACRRRASAGG